jgi:hypothetical protein
MRRQATVSAVDTATGTVTVQLAGDPTNLAGIAYLASYTPSVNDVVWVDKLETDWLVIGAQVPALLPPRGIIKEARVTANQSTASSTDVDITSLTVTWTADPGRTYLVTGRVLGESNQASDIFHFSLTDSGNNLKCYAPERISDAGTGQAIIVERSFGPVTGDALSGSVTMKLRMRRNSGTSTITMDASAANPSWLRVVDITGAPS